jgi:hypothetical protein
MVTDSNIREGLREFQNIIRSEGEDATTQKEL